MKLTFFCHISPFNMLNMNDVINDVLNYFFNHRKHIFPFSQLLLTECFFMYIFSIFNFCFFFFISFLEGFFILIYLYLLIISLSLAASFILKSSFMFFFKIVPGLRIKFFFLKEIQIDNRESSFWSLQTDAPF